MTSLSPGRPGVQEAVSRHCFAGPDSRMLEAIQFFPTSFRRGATWEVRRPRGAGPDSIWVASRLADLFRQRREPQTMGGEL